MMQALWLDYQQLRPGRHWPGIALLILGVALTGVLLYQYHLINQALEVEEKSGSNLKRKMELNRIQEGYPEGSKDTEAIAKLTTRTIARWESLFGTLELAGDETVTLIGITSNLHEVSIVGEAKSINAALEYQKRLQTSKTLANVHMTEQEILKDHPRHPLRFTIVLDWPEATQ